MASLAEYFKANRYMGKYNIGDRVIGKWNKIPFVGTVGNDTLINEIEGPRISVCLDLLINFKDLELEKHYIFYRYLSKKLTKKSKEKINIENLIDLESLRIQKLHDYIDPLEQIDHKYEGISITAGVYNPPTKDLLSDIIATMNERYGVNLNDDDKVNIDIVCKKIFENEEIAKYMNGANSEQNKNDYFKQQFDNVILTFLKDRFEFFKKLDENSGLKNLIFDKIYKDYVNNRLKV